MRYFREITRRWIILLTEMFDIELFITTKKLETTLMPNNNFVFVITIYMSAYISILLTH